MAKRRRRGRITRRQVQIAGVLLAVAAVVLGILLFAHELDKSSPSAPPVAGLNGPDGSDGASASPSPSGTGSNSSILSVFPAQLTSKLGKNFRGLPGHNVVLTVSSAGSILRVGYLVPSADSNQVGDLHNVNGGFSKSFTARGPEGPYSAIFIQTNNDGTPVHCTVTVDGATRDSETISGKKKQGLCYG